MTSLRNWASAKSPCTFQNSKNTTIFIKHFLIRLVNTAHSHQLNITSATAISFLMCYNLSKCFLVMCTFMMWCHFPLAMNNCWCNLKAWKWLWPRRYQYCNRLNMSFLVKLNYHPVSNANKLLKSSHLWKSSFHVDKLCEKVEVLELLTQKRHFGFCIYQVQVFLYTFPIPTHIQTLFCY